MRIAVIGDVHGATDQLDRTLARLACSPVELALLTGDVGLDPPRVAPSQRGVHDASVQQVIGCVGAVLDCPVLFVPGNHDLPDPPTDAPGVNIDGLVIEACGLRIAGLGGAGPAQFGFPYEWTEPQAAAVLATFAAPIDLLLCHTPPIGTSLDRTRSGHHVGSQAVRLALARLQPKLFLCGHIHEAWGEETIEGVPCLNAGALGPPYGQRIGWWVDWEDGPQRITVRR